MNKTFFTTVTPFSKLVALTILVVGPFVGFYLGIRYQKIAAVPVNTNNSVELSSVEEQFIKSNFRVLTVLKNPNAPNYLIIATDKSAATCGSPENPSRCDNDTGCGGMYFSPTCYFFEEPDFAYGANPQTRFVGKYEGYAVNLDSFVFKDANIVEFSGGFGDAGYGVITKNSLNLTNGQTTELSKEEFTSEL